MTKSALRDEGRPAPFDHGRIEAGSGAAPCASTCIGAALRDTGRSLRSAGRNAGGSRSATRSTRTAWSGWSIRRRRTVIGWRALLRCLSGLIDSESNEQNEGSPQEVFTDDHQNSSIESFHAAAPERREATGQVCADIRNVIVFQTTLGFGIYEI